jgi:hypothetical protein
MSLRSIAFSAALLAGVCGLLAAQTTPPPPPVPGQGYYGQQPRPVYQPAYVSDPAYQRGLQDGIAEGQKDRHKNHDYRATKDGKYEHPPDYDPSYGDKEHWKRVYQSGFAAGYYQGYYGVVPAPYVVAQAPVVVAPAVPVPTNPGYQRGFQDGVSDGQQDRADAHEYRAMATGKYQHTPGYDSSYGDKDQYKEFYRQGYAAGYQQGFGAVTAPVATAPAYPQPSAYTDSQAYQLGYRDGISDGRDDRQSGKAYRATTTDKFQDAPGYSDALGSKDQYKELYRHGYVDGYQTAFSGPVQPTQ